MKLKEPPPDMVVPHEIEIRLSHVNVQKLGLWCKKTIKKGSRFGPFVGEKALEVDDKMDPTYIWEIVDVETKEFLFYINATDPRRGNWMRYINCARFFEEQNIVSEQDGIDIFYEAIKDIEPGEELLTWYEKTPLRKKKGKRRPICHVRRARTSQVSTRPQNQPAVPTASVSQRGRRRSAKKYWEIEETADPRDAAEAAGEDSDDNNATDADKPPKTSPNSSHHKNTGDSSTGLYFQFELLPIHTGKNRLGRKMFQCDICAGVYRHGFSLKRHYIRNHINRRYISRVDALNCNVSLSSSKTASEEYPSSEISTEAEKSDPTSKGTQGTAAAKSDQVDSESSQPEISSKIPPDDEATLQLDVEEIDGSEMQESPRMSETAKDPPAGKRKLTQSLPGLYRCYLCEKLFDMASELKTHFADKHSNGAEKRFACRHCQMQFKHRQNLVRHEVVHTGAKPYICEHCNKRFPTLTNRRRHERIHCGTRLACSLCPSSFTQTGDLKKHVRRQHPESYRACAYCSRYFTADSQLSVHLRRAHPGSDLDANRRRAGAQRDARCAALEADRAESRRIAAAGSSSEQFACTVCMKTFADYANMCRHRRLAHGCGVGVDPDGSSSDGEEGSSGYSNGHGVVCSDMSDAQQAFFAGVAQNIATNLRYHMEGNEEHLSRASSHIRWRLGSANTTVSLTNGDVKLEEFNFPHGFEIKSPTEMYSTPPSLITLDSVTEIKEEESNNGSSQDLSGSCELMPTADSDKTVLPNGSGLGENLTLEPKIEENGESNGSELSCDQPLDLSGSFSKHSALSDDDDQSARDIRVIVEKTAGVCTPVTKERKLVCLVCLREFSDSALLGSHQLERHPNIDCRHIEVDADFCAADIGKRPNAVGMLNVSSSLLPADLDELDCKNSSEVMCTKCKRQFPSRSVLHAHIVDCGDYWRSLSDRLTWVFVLRGSQLPAPTPGSLSSSSSSRKQQRRRGKFRWGTISSKDSMRRQLQQMLIRQHVGITDGAVGTGAETRRASNRVSAHHSTELLQTEIHAGTRLHEKKSSHKPHHPRRHIRRRASGRPGTVTVEDTFRCDLCAALFASAAEVESHMASCQAAKANSNDTVSAGNGNKVESDGDDIDPSKHLCIYCGRQFTFVRALRRHVCDSCTVRKELIDKNEYIDDEWEQQLAAIVAGKVSCSIDSIEDAADNSADPRRSGGKRRRRCKNWGNKSKSQSRRSARSSDDADDSLFGWEDAYLSTWGKDEREEITGKNQQTARGSAGTGTVSALEKLLTSNIAIKIGEKGVRTTSDDLDSLMTGSAVAGEGSEVSTATPVVIPSSVPPQAVPSAAPQECPEVETALSGSPSVTHLATEAVHPVTAELNQSNTVETAKADMTASSSDEVKHDEPEGVRSETDDPPVVDRMSEDAPAFVPVSESAHMKLAPVDGSTDPTCEQPDAELLTGAGEADEDLEDVDDGDETAESGGKRRKRRVRRLTVAKRKRS